MGDHIGDVTKMVGDTISRAVAIEIVRKAKDKSEAHRMLIQMPSAQPEYTEQDIRDQFDAGYTCGMEAAQIEVVLCKYCKHYDQFPNGTNGTCEKHIDARVSFYPWDFCSKGERRTDG